MFIMLQIYIPKIKDAYDFQAGNLDYKKPPDGEQEVYFMR